MIFLTFLDRFFKEMASLCIVIFFILHLIPVEEVTAMQSGELETGALCLVMELGQGRYATNRLTLSSFNSYFN